MEKLKHIICLVAILLSINSFAQQPNPFLGTWHYQNGNNVFVVSLWEDNEGNILGHYKMITVNSYGLPSGIIYNSRKSFANSIEKWPFALYAGHYEGGN